MHMVGIHLRLGGRRSQDEHHQREREMSNDLHQLNLWLVTIPSALFTRPHFTRNGGKGHRFGGGAGSLWPSTMTRRTPRYLSTSFLPSGRRIQDVGSALDGE